MRAVDNITAGAVLVPGTNRPSLMEHLLLHLIGSSQPIIKVSKGVARFWQDA